MTSRGFARVGARTLLVVAVLVALAGCDWTSFGFDGGNTRYSPKESTITVANVPNIKAAFAGITAGVVESSPSVANGVAYVGSADGYLYAFDAAGKTNCNTSTKQCTPLWKGNVSNTAPGDPTVAGGVVFQVTPGGLSVFDAAGKIGCSGSPKICSPMWQSAYLGSGGTGDAVVADGKVYIDKGGKLYAFDAAGTTGCSGSPKICNPLFSGTGAGSIGEIAVLNGLVYMGGGSNARVWVFDAKGANNCSGSPKVCVALWSTSKGGNGAVIAGGRLYSADQYGLYAFDAAGANSCTGIPVVCAPRWTYSVGTGFSGAPAVANGVLYVGHSSGSYSLLAAFDANGSTNCGGSPKVCTSLWESTTADALGNVSSPAVANGVVFIGSRDGSLYAFDAAGSSGCSGIPKRCNPRWSSPTNAQVNSSPVVVDGTVFVGSENKSLYAFK